MGDHSPDSPASPPSLDPPRASAPRPPHSPTTDPGIGKYRLLAELGRGGMADVFLAMTAGPGGFSKLLVLKQLRLGDDPLLVSMFLDEARLAARVSHPNIVQTFEVVQEQSRAFMVMEFLDGPSLSRLRRVARSKNTRVPLAVELKILCDSLLGLHYAHELRGYDGKALGVVHRDFTPQNLMVTYGGDVKIVDFGIAKALDHQTKTSAGMFKGKLTYVPPEQLMGLTIDRRADVFSAGVMLYEAVTGDSPWKDLTNAAVTHALGSGRIPRLMEAAEAHPELAAICDQAMAVDPDDRYATADELRAALEEFVREQHLELDRVQLGAYVESMLGEVRERTRQVIDEQLKHLHSLPSADTLAQTLPTLDGLTPSPKAKVVGRSLPALMISETMPDTGQGAAVAPSRKGPWVAAGAALGLALAGLLAFFFTRPTPAPATPTALPEQPAIPVVVAPPNAVARPAEPTAPASVAVRIRATPATAHVQLDELELPSNPFDGTYPRDSAVHALRVWAPGYVEVRRGVQFERDLTLEVSLSRVGARPTKAAPVVTTAAPSAPEPKTNPTKETDDPEYFPPASTVKKQTKRPLDPNIEFH
jgi:eukaryotic-like serine/threonine-protein kinase